MGKLKKNILITGGSGFIGKNLVEYLSPKFNIFAPSHEQLELLDETAVFNFISSNKIQIVIHCANVGGGRDTAGTKDIVYKNCRMFFSLTRNLSYLERIIHLGSGAEYGKSRSLILVSEDEFDKIIPLDGYGFAKYTCSKFIENSSKIICLRLFSVFGKYENCYFKFISNSIVKNLLKIPINIGQNVYFDFLYIDDLLKIIDYFISNKTRYKMYNVASGKRIDLVTIARLVNQIGKGESKIIVENPNLNLEYTANINRLQKEIPNFKFTPFKSALMLIYKWYLQNIHLIDKEKIIKDPYLKYITINKN